MKTLNKFMVNRLAYLLQLIKENRWLELEFVIEQNSIFGRNWDNAEPDDGQMRKLIEKYLQGGKR
jgi:hypothetical protein